MDRLIGRGVAAILKPILWNLLARLTLLIGLARLGSPGRSWPRCPGRQPAIATLLALGVLLTIAGCRGMTSRKPPIHLNPSMDNQPKARAQSESLFFYDGSTMRQPVPGTVARGELREDRALYEGKDAEGKDLALSPVPVTPELLARGAERYQIYCRPCHDPRGDGKGVLATRGGVPTTSIHDPKVLGATDGHIYSVITKGQGLMPAYRWPIPPLDRWAIVAHVRHLQQQRHAKEAAQ